MSPHFGTRLRLGFGAYPALFAFGAVLGTLWDQLHVRAGTLAYFSPDVAGQPWWVPLEFGFAFVAGGALFTMLGDPAPRPRSSSLASAEGAWLTAIYAITAFLDERPYVVAGILLIALIARAGNIAETVMASPVPVIALVILGPLAEVMLIRADLFQYRIQQLGPIPIWLPLLWANGVLFMARLSEAMLQRFGVRRRVEPATAVVNPGDSPGAQRDDQ